MITKILAWTIVVPLAVLSIPTLLLFALFGLATSAVDWALDQIPAGDGRWDW